MDAFVRCLRDGCLEEHASIGFIVDSLHTHGGGAVFRQVLHSLLDAIKGGRSQSQHVHAIALDTAPSELAAAGVHSVTDCYTDPCSWNTTSTIDSQQIRWNDMMAIQQLAGADAAGWRAAGVSGSGRCCVVLAGLSTLLMRHQLMQVVQVLQSLQRNPCVSSILMQVTQDLHSSQVMSALQSLASSVLQLHPVEGLQLQLITQATGRPCHGQLTVSSKRLKVGRLRVEQQLYRLLNDGAVEIFAPPEGKGSNARSLVETSLATSKLLQMQSGAAAAAQQGTAAGLQPGAQQQQQQQSGSIVAAAAAGDAAGGEDLARKLGSSMRLEMSEQERAAKAAVQLPYVHQGAGKAYESGDFKQYLPPAAGGYGPGVVDTQGSGKLGHILYVRDSEEEHDSDEDPDDDLDI